MKNGGDQRDVCEMASFCTLLSSLAWFVWPCLKRGLQQASGDMGRRVRRVGVTPKGRVCGDKKVNVLMTSQTLLNA